MSLPPDVPPFGERARVVASIRNLHLMISRRTTCTDRLQPLPRAVSPLRGEAGVVNAVRRISQVEEACVQAPRTGVAYAVTMSSRDAAAVSPALTHAERARDTSLLPYMTSRGY